MTGIAERGLQTMQGARHSAFPQDVSPVIDLLENCFAAKLDSNSRQAFTEYRQIAALGSLAWNLSRWMGIVHAEEWFGGVVWQEDDRVIGNASITPAAFSPHSWLIGNVAVHPDHRCRGVGRALMQYALSEIHARGGRTAYLQVDVDNEAACHLYRSLGFVDIERRQVWFRGASSQIRVSPVAISAGACETEQRKATDCLAEFRFLLSVSPHGLAWNMPLTRDRLQPSLARQLSQFFAGESEFHWLVRQEGAVLGVEIVTQRFCEEDILLILKKESAPGHALDLLAKEFELNGFEVSRTLETNSIDQDALLARLGFERKRDLVWMKRDED